MTISATIIDNKKSYNSIFEKYLPNWRDTPVDKISIKQLSLNDANKLFDFEIENRSYFKTIGLSRSDAYYDRNLF